MSLATFSQELAAIRPSVKLNKQYTSPYGYQIAPDAEGGFYMCFVPDARSAAMVHDWAVENEIPQAVPQKELHCTIVYSASLPYPGFNAKGRLSPPATATIKGMKVLGEDSLVLLLDCKEAVIRNKQAMLNGCTSDYPSYIAHMTVGTLPKGSKLPKLKLPPYTIRFDFEYSAPLRKTMNFSNPYIGVLAASLPEYAANAVTRLITNKASTVKRNAFLLEMAASFPETYKEEKGLKPDERITAAIAKFREHLNVFANFDYKQAAANLSKAIDAVEAASDAQGKSDAVKALAKYFSTKDDPETFGEEFFIAAMGMESVFKSLERSTAAMLKKSSKKKK